MIAMCTFLLLGRVCGRDPGLDTGNFHALIKKVSEALKDLVYFLI